MQVAHKRSGNQSVLKMLQQVYSISRHTHTDNRTIQFLHIDIKKQSHVRKHKIIEEEFGRFGLHFVSFHGKSDRKIKMNTKIYAEHHNF